MRVFFFVTFVLGNVCLVQAHAQCHYGRNKAYTQTRPNIIVPARRDTALWGDTCLATRKTQVHSNHKTQESNQSDKKSKKKGICAPVCFVEIRLVIARLELRQKRAVSFSVVGATCKSDIITTPTETQSNQKTNKYKISVKREEEEEEEEEK